VRSGPGRGDALLVLPFLEGVPLGVLLDKVDRLDSPGPELRSQLAALGRVLHLLHAAGFVHGDLHEGNVLVTSSGPVLLDLQHARRSRRRAARARDLGELDFALWNRVSVTARVRLRLAALGATLPLDPATRQRLRAVGDAALRRAWRHGRSRTRRALRPGRLYARLALPGGTGLRWRAFPAAAAAAALAAHRSALAAAADSPQVWKCDGRSRITAVDALGHPVVVKEVLPRGLSRRLADVFRGSAARRAWRAGHGLAMRGVGAARPLAFLEQRRLGLPQASWLILARRSDCPDAVALAPRAPEAVLDALLHLALQLQLRGVEHGDLKGSHVLLDPQRGLAPCLVDLEGVHFRRRLSDAQRLEALAQLNASLPDDVPTALRLERFRRYAARHPFACGNARALEQLVARSLARAHRWSGADCACARRQRSQ